MENLQKKQNINPSKVVRGGGYKSLISASLALALGVSVASASDTISTSQVNIATSGDKNIAADTNVTTASDIASDGKAGILVKPTSAGVTTINVVDNAKIGQITGAETFANAYGIYVANDAQATTFKNDSAFKTITIATLPKAHGDGAAYIFKNAGTGAATVTFNKVGIVAGALPTTNTPTNFGIYSALAGASYAFGSTDAKTVFTSVKQGVIASKATTLGGNLEIGNTAADNTDGKANVAGLVLKDGANLTANTLAMKVSSTNGNATAIALEGTAQGNAANIVVDSITLNASSITSKDDAANSAYALSNTGNTSLSGTIALADGAFAGSNVKKIVLDNKGTLTLSNATIASGDASALTNTPKIGIHNSIAGAIFNFGTTKSSLSTENGADATAKSPSAATGAKNIYAFNLGADTNMTGNLTFTSVTAGNGGNGTTATHKDGAAGGSVYGINATADSTLTLGDANTASSIVFTALTAGKGGNSAKGQSGTVGTGGSAYGICTSNDKTLTFKGNGSIQVTALTAGLGGSEAAKSTGRAKSTDGQAYILKNANTTAAKEITFGQSSGAATNSHVSLVAGSAKAPTDKTAYAIYSNLEGAKYDFGALNSGADVGTKFYFVGANGADAAAAAGRGTATAATVGESVTGFYVAHAATAEGKLLMDVKAGNGGNGDATNKNGAKGGDATAISLASGTLNLGKTSAAGKVAITATAGNGGDGDAGSGTKGSGGDAYGIVAGGTSAITLVENTPLSLTIKAGQAGSTGKNPGSAGDAVGILVKGTKDAQASLSITGTGLTLAVGDGTKKANNAYGLKLEDGSFSGSLKFANASASKVIAKENAYAIHSSGKSALSGTILIDGFDTTGTTKGINGKNTYALYNVGDLTLGKNAAIKIKTGTNTATISSDLGASSTLVLGSLNASNTDATSKNYVFEVKSANTVLDLKVSEQALDDTNSGYVLNLGGKTQVFALDSAQNTAKINLDLGTFAKDNATKAVGTKVIFHSDAGAINTLKGSNAEILLAGANQKELEGRYESRTLTVTDMQLTDSHIVLGVTNSYNKKSDKIVIEGATTATEQKPLNNTLHVALNGYYANETKNEKDVAILAEVASSVKDKVIFNGLAKDKQEVDSTVYSGFTIGEVAIKRYDDTATKKTYYVSNLEAANLQINSDFIAPTTAALSTGVSLFSANLNSLSKRMGELRNDPYSHGVWARVFGGEQTTNFGAKQSTVYTTVQAGYDYKLGLDNAANYMGVAISYTKGSGGQTDTTEQKAKLPVGVPYPLAAYGLSSSNTDGVEVALYNSYVSESGLYSDTIAKFGYYMSDLTMFGQTDTYNTSNFAAAVSEEIGYKVKLGSENEWFITPQGEIAFAYMGGTDFTQVTMDGSSMKSSQDAVSLLRARVGAAWGYDFSHLAKTSDVKASIYLGTYYAYDYFIGGDTTLSTNVGNKVVDFKHNAYEATGRFVMNIGTNIDVQERTKVYFDFEKSFGGKIQTDYQVSLGVRFGFGEKVSAPKQEESKADAPALKPKALNEEAEAQETKE